MLEDLAGAIRAVPVDEIARHPLLHEGALGVGKGFQPIAASSGQCALAAGSRALAASYTGLFRRETRMDRDGGLFFSEEEPVPLFLRRIAPWFVDVVSQRDDDIAG